MPPIDVAPRRSRRSVAAALALTLGVSGAVALTPAAPAAAAYPDTFNPFAISGGFTVYARESAVLRNTETEGSIAASDTTTVDNGGTYSLVHVAAGTADYTLPTVDGDPTRLLTGEYSTASTGLLEITSAGTSDPTLQGDLKLVDRTGPFQPFARADFLRLNQNPSNADQTPLIDSLFQQYPADAAAPTSPVGDGSIYTYNTSASAVADYVEANAEASWDDASTCLAGLPDTAYRVGIAESAGDRVVLGPLSPDQVNVVDYADIAGASLIQFSAGPTPGTSNPLVIQVPAGTTAVTGARIDPQGQYSPYTLWDLSQVSGEVTVTAGQGRIDGSIYAPNADITVNAAPLDGQIIGNNVTVEGGEVHSFIFAGTLNCGDGEESGSFAVEKALSGIGEDDLPAGTMFTVDYDATEPDGTVVSGSLDVPADGTPVDAGVDFPVGTVITFDEIDPATIPGWEWGDPTIDPASIEIASGATPTITVTNAATEQLGSISLQKEVVDTTGAPIAGLDDATVDVEWEGTDGQAGTVSLPLDGDVVDVPAQFPIGTSVTFEEDLDSLPVINGYDWVSSSWSPDSTVTVSDTSTTALVLTNVAQPQASTDRTIGIVKSATGDGAADFDYSLTYNTDAADTAGLRSEVDLQPGRPVVLDDVDDDVTTLRLVENPPTVNGEALPPAAWETPVVSVTTASGTETVDGVYGEPGFNVDIPASGWVFIRVTNELKQGAFDLQKAFASGLDAGALRDDIAFTVTWTATTPGGDQTTGTIRLPANGTPVSPLDSQGDPLTFPYGTTITYEETAAPGVPGLTWNTPTYDPDPLTIGTDDTATVSGTVTNSATWASGTFQVSKELVGVDPDQLLVDELEISYRGVAPFIGEVDGSFEIPTDGTAAGPVDADGEPIQFPVGTVLRLSEATTPDEALPDGYEWAGTTWSPASFVVIGASAQTPVLTVTNSVQQLTRYAATKTVAGDAAGSVPADTAFPVLTWVDGEVGPEVDLTAGVTFTSAWLPVGTIVQVQEGALPELSGVVWGTPVWQTADGTVLEPEPDGTVVLPAAQMGTQDTVELSLVNQATTQPTVAFSVTKTISGSGASTVPSDTPYGIEYTVNGGSVQTASVTVGEALTVTDVPVGAVVRIRETAPPAIDDITWGSPTWSADGEQLTADADGWVSVTLGSDDTLAFSLANTATAPDELPVTGGTWSTAVTYAGLAALLLGIAVLLHRRRTTTC